MRQFDESQGLAAYDINTAFTLYWKLHNITFGVVGKDLGSARIANRDGGRKIGIRAPMRDAEEPVVRPYTLVEDIDAAVAAADKSRAKIAMSPNKAEAYGQFDIIIHGGIEPGL